MHVVGTLKSDDEAESSPYKTERVYSSFIISLLNSSHTIITMWIIKMAQ